MVKNHCISLHSLKGNFDHFSRKNVKITGNEECPQKSASIYMTQNGFFFEMCIHSQNVNHSQNEFFFEMCIHFQNVVLFRNVHSFSKWVLFRNVHFFSKCENCVKGFVSFFSSFRKTQL